MERCKEIRKLIDILNAATAAYDAGKPEMTDKEWDELYFELSTLEEKNNIYYPDSPTQHIEFKQVSALNKVTHNHPMLSLNKTKLISEVKAFVGNKPVVIMGKMDGLTISARYMNGKLVSLETRGNGEIGEDVTHNSVAITNLPLSIPYDDELVVDGEAIITYKDFEPFADTYANPRNLVSGSIRLLDAEETKKRHITFVAWDLIKSGSNFETLDKKLEWLKELGFTIVPHVTNETMTDFSDTKINEIKTICGKAGLPIDGIVVKYNDCDYYNSLGHTDHHFKGGLAFKFYDEEYSTKLLDIEYDVSRRGILTPVAVFEDVDTGDSTVNRASLHNISVMRSLNNGHSYIGDDLTIIKANMIIPQVTQWSHTNTESEILIPAHCPVCDGKTEIRNDNGSEILYCTNPQCPRKLVNQLVYFTGKKGLDIKGLSEKTLERLMDMGWLESVANIFTLDTHKSEWIKMSGFGVASVTKILDAIEASRDVSLDKFICSCGIPEIGTKASRDLANKFKTWNNFRAATFAELNAIAGIGEIMAANIIHFNYEEYDYIAEQIMKNVNSEIESAEADENPNVQTLSGKTLVITGKLTQFKNRDELVAAIEAKGGKVTGSVSSKTDILVNNDVNSTSSKNVKAKELGIPIMSELDLIKEFAI